MKGFLVAVLFMLFLSLASGVHAQIIGGSNPGSGTNIKLDNPIGCGDFQCVMTKITGALFMVSIPIVAIMVLWGGFQILTAGGNEERYKTGRKTILYAAVGFVVVLLADSVAGILESIFKTQ